jgi:RimJ/RimL family protein N-acetyltransferase
MLANAKNYEAELVKLFNETAYDRFYDFYRYAVGTETLKIPDDTWNGHYFASVIGAKVIGYIGYGIRRPEPYAESLGIIRFGGRDAGDTAERQTFGKDVMTALKDIFERYGFIKLKFSCVIGNPMEKTYDKLIKRYGGRIVGVHKNETRLLDGKLYDVKLYEILAEEYFASKKK